MVKHGLFFYDQNIANIKFNLRQYLKHYYELMLT